MKIHNSVAVVLGILVTVTLCSLTFPQDRGDYKNLKVLPKDISHDALDSIMKSFNTSLGVKCNFCHAPQADNPKKLDFASDENKHKGISRDMMRMTARINKKYFKGEQPSPMTCYTCHNGNKHPRVSPPVLPDEDE